MYNKIKRELYATDCECFEIKFYTADRLPCLAAKCSKNDHLNLEECTSHLLGLPNRASLRLFQERSSAVTFILMFFPHRVVNLLNISSVFTEL